MQFSPAIRVGHTDMIWVSDDRCEWRAVDTAWCGRAGNCLECQLIEANGRPMTESRAGVPSLTMLGAAPAGWGGSSGPNIV
jgi:hypothetical protein